MLTKLELNYLPDSTVISDLNHQYSATEIISRCNLLLEQLANYEIYSLALLADNGVDWIAPDDLACQHADLCILPIPTFFSAPQIEHAIGSCQLNAVVTDNPNILSALPLSSYQVLGELAGTDLQLVLLKQRSLQNAMPPGTGKITFTSGSTGHPRGVCLSHWQLQQQADALASCVDLANPRHLCLLPLSTLLENVAGIYGPLLCGGEIIVPSQEALGFHGSALVDQRKLLTTISATQPETLILVPQLLLFLVAAVEGGWQAPTSLKFIAVGGSKVSQQLLEDARKQGLPVYEGYGLSECCSVVSLNTAAAQSQGTCGKPLQDLQLSFDRGEVCVSGNAMLGYINEPDSWNPEAIHTGDLGHLDAAGFLHVDGRKKNLLISSFGRNISPEWVESELLASPLLAEAVVVGDGRPYCSALLGLRDPDTPASVVQAWIDRVNKRLPDYAQVRHWQSLSRPLSREAGLLTENGRPKRDAINSVFATDIENLYRDEAVA